jgi:hypothetical protein
MRGSRRNRYAPTPRFREGFFVGFVGAGAYEVSMCGINK